VEVAESREIRDDRFRSKHGMRFEFDRIDGIS
jgi:hypothetical protein